MPNRTAILALMLATLAGPAAAQDASGAAITADDRASPVAPAAAAPASAASVAIELGDVELKVRRVGVIVTLDPEDAAALAGALSGAAVRIDGEGSGG